MKRHTVSLLVALAALVLFGENRVRAEMVEYAYSWTVMPSAVIPGGTGSVTFAVVPDGTATSELGSSMPTLIPGANITTSSSATDPPDEFNASMSMKLTLTDMASSQSGELTFAATLTGTLNSTQSTLTTTFLEPVTQQLTLGDHLYTVTVDPTIISLPEPGSATQALADALVTVSSTQTTPPPPPPVSQVPEPSSLLLGMTAVAGLAARGCFRRRRRCAA